MAKHCILCGAEIEDEEQYEKNRAALTRPLRYQDTIDTLIDSPRGYDLILFDHQEQLPSPYRGIAFRKTSALQVEPGKGRALHVKEADITAVKGEYCDIVIEEEMQPNQEKVEEDVQRITPCRYLWTNNRQFELHSPTLFVLINGNPNRIPTTVRRNVGCFKQVIVCEEQEFRQLFEKHYLQGR